MKHIRHFEGLSQNNPSKEDILDYFYELTDSKEISELRSEIGLKENHKHVIRIFFTINNPLRTYNTTDFSNTLKFLSKIESIARRWKLDIGLDLSEPSLHVCMDVNPKFQEILNKYNIGEGHRNLNRLLPTAHPGLGLFMFSLDKDLNYLLEVDIITRTKLKLNIPELIMEQIDCELQSSSDLRYTFKLIL
jgi:hypothetical protein